jgi:hypothetical protein
VISTGLMLPDMFLVRLVEEVDDEQARDAKQTHPEYRDAHRSEDHERGEAEIHPAFLADAQGN